MPNGIGAFLHTPQLGGIVFPLGIDAVNGIGIGTGVMHGNQVRIINIPAARINRIGNRVDAVINAIGTNGLHRTPVEHARRQ